MPKYQNWRQWWKGVYIRGPLDYEILTPEDLRELRIRNSWLRIAGIESQDRCSQKPTIRKTCHTFCYHQWHENAEDVHDRKRSIRGLNKYTGMILRDEPVRNTSWRGQAFARDRLVRVLSRSSNRMSILQNRIGLSGKGYPLSIVLVIMRLRNVTKWKAQKLELLGIPQREEKFEDKSAVATVKIRTTIWVAVAQDFESTVIWKRGDSLGEHPIQKVLGPDPHESDVSAVCATVWASIITRTRVDHRSDKNKSKWHSSTKSLRYKIWRQISGSHDSKDNSDAPDTVHQAWKSCSKTYTSSKTRTKLHSTPTHSEECCTARLPSPKAATIHEREFVRRFSKLESMWSAGEGP